MTDVVKVALVTGFITLINGPLVIALVNKKSKQLRDIREIKAEQSRLFLLLDRIADGLSIGLQNDRIIFRALREHSINGESEAQEKVMEAYFTQCLTYGLKPDREEKGGTLND